MSYLNGNIPEEVMIQNTFLFLDGIGDEKEKHLWQQRITDWHEFLGKEKIKGISTERKGKYDEELRTAKTALVEYNSSYFIKILPSSETWRLYQHFKDDAVFLDIETSGVSRYDNVTVVGLFDGFNTKIMIHRINLDMAALKEELKKYKLIVTFNGAVFDIPFLKKRYPHLIPNIPIVDLRVPCERIGLKGGLKKIEKELGIKRNPIIEKLCGGDAALLWRMFRGSGDDFYLKLLVEYNEEDVINLKRIAEYSISQLTPILLKTKTISL